MPTDRMQEHRHPSRPPDALACHLAPPSALPLATLASHPALHPRPSGVSLAAAARSASPSIETLASAPLQLTPPFLVGVAAAAAVGIGVAVDGNLCLSAAPAHDAPSWSGSPQRPPSGVSPAAAPRSASPSTDPWPRHHATIHLATSVLVGFAAGATARVGERMRTRCVMKHNAQICTRSTPF